MGNSITRCRICGNDELAPILDLGIQALCGVFPRAADDIVTKGPLELLKCMGDDRTCCGLVQLAHSNDLNEMYGMNYGYRSGLNAGMVRHLHAKVSRILELAPLRDGDLIVDIGANDSTTLQAYPVGRYDIVGIDPTGIKFRQYYPPHIRLIPEFFSGAQFRSHFGSRRARVVTSFSMFYDLENPQDFVREIASILEDDGIWIFEQSYLPTMLETNSFDTVCHEHLEYYALRQIIWMAERAGLSIVDVELNDVNGGSFSVVASKAGGAGRSPSQSVTRLLAHERELGIDRLETYAAFARRTDIACGKIRDFLVQAKSEGKSVYGLGASTKGNVLLQYAGIDSQLLAGIAEVNPDKFGCVTPGTHVPIMSEEEVFAQRPDYLLVLPWHFRRFFLASQRLKGQCLVFPLPKLELVQM